MPLIFGFIVILASLASGEMRAGNMRPGYPENWQSLDSREVAMLPNYCKHTQTYRSKAPEGPNPVEISRWTAIMGPTFNHMHHYCNGLLQTNRALLFATNAQTRKFYLDSSIGEFDYVIDRAPADFPLLPEILTKKGENQLRLGRDVAGVETLQRAIGLKRDYWPPYVALADYYERRGHRAQAREVLEKALESAPDSKRVKARLTELEKARGNK